jgi:hypothetical protein
MPRIGACVVMSVLAAAIVTPSPIMAFGLRIGPVHFGLPFLAVRHRIAHRHMHMAHRDHVRTHIRHRAGFASAPAVERASRNVGGGESAPSNNDSAVLYPSLAIPSLANDVFWPNRSSPWPFSYDAIFRTTFAKSLPAQDAQSCQGNAPAAGLIVARVQSELRLNAVQQQLLQRLGGALGMASAALAKACPPAVPVEPVARLQLMQAQVAALSMAVDLIRPPLQQFEESLNAEQRAKFAAVPSVSDGAIACGNATSTDWSVDQISQSVQPGDDQREALADLREAFVSAAGDLGAHCPKMLPPDPLARLESIESRLDASWRAVLGMQVALASFESRLTDSQRTRFEAMNVAEAR